MSMPPCFSDALLSNLDPVEPHVLNVSKLTGMTAAIFEDIVKLTFIGDEKQGANPLLPAAVTHNASEVKG